MKVETLERRIGEVARVRLASFPTPLEPCKCLSAQLGGPALWVKRDDTIGPAMGGNKTRKLEFLMADARQRRARKVVTFGGPQSNHARITAAAARAMGMEPHLFFFEPRPAKMQGNLLLDEVLGARLHFFPLGGSGGMTLETTNRLVSILSWALVGPGRYFIPVGGHNALGCLGYVLCAVEIHQQAESLGLRDVTVVTAAGTGGTLAGLWAGFALLGSPVRVLGIDVGKLWKGFPLSVARLAGEICALLGEPRAFAPADVPLIENRYVGQAYGTPSPEGLAAIRTLARTEGLILDPIYTGKAMAGLLDLHRRGYWRPEETLVLLHTGGAPGLFAFPEIP